MFSRCMCVVFVVFCDSSKTVLLHDYVLTEDIFCPGLFSLPGPGNCPGPGRSSGSSRGSLPPPPSGCWSPPSHRREVCMRCFLRRFLQTSFFYWGYRVVLLFVHILEERKYVEKIGRMKNGHVSTFPCLHANNAERPHLLLPSQQRLHKVRFLQKLGCQKPCWDQARLSSLVNKQVSYMEE